MKPIVVDPRPIAVVEEQTPESFEKACALLVEQGYRCFSSACSYEDGAGTFYQAIFMKEDC